MAAADILAVIAAVSAGAAGVALAFSAQHAARRSAQAGRVRSRVIGGAGPGARILQTGISPLLPLARRIVRIPRAKRVLEGVCRVLHARGHAADADRVCSVWAAAFIAVLAAGSVLASSAVFGAAAAVGLTVAGCFVADRFADGEAERMRAAVPDALRSMETCFRAGLSLMQTFEQLAREFDGSLGAAFERVARELETGSTVEEALRTLRQSEGAPELSFVAVALKVQHDAGGSMQRVLAAARDSIEGELELRRSLKVKTAQAKLSAQVVSAMPLVLVAVFSLVSEGFLAPFFSSATGLVLLAAVAMQVGGIAMVRRTLRVRVD